MIEKSTTWTVLENFFTNPTTEFHLRELSRLLGKSMPTIISSTDKLSEKNLIIKIKGKVITKLMANRENVKFLQYKRLYNLKMIYDSDVLLFISKAYNNPRLVALFGSYSRGEDTEDSDIDIAVVTNKKIALDMTKFEKKLQRRISIHEVELERVSNEFKANLANGIVLEGSW